jgi:protein SCO1
MLDRMNKTTDSRMKSCRAPGTAVLWLLLAVSLLLGGCQRNAPLPFQLTDISGHMPALDFKLTDDQGKAVSAADYRGKVVLLYFGYTHCPDVCPLTLAQLHVVMQRLGKLADGARILFVSVDPTRDTPAVLHAYVNAFDPHTVGLTGDPRVVEALVKRYRSSFTREPASSDGNYEVSHSSAIYVFDRDGNARVLSTPTDSQDDLVHDLHLLLSTGTNP